MLSDYLDWSDDQWEEYEDSVVEIPLSQLGTFATACELLSQGRRLDAEERKAWVRHLKDVFPVYVEALISIQKKGA